MYCIDKGECIVHQIFGSKGNEGLIAVYADPITSISHKTAQTEVQVQNVHIATENRVCRSFEGKTIQDFGERYFSGEFTFEIDVTKCSPEQLGLVIEAVMNLAKLGRGFNSGYGKVQIKSLQLVERTIKKDLVWEAEEFRVTQKIREKSLKTEVLTAREAFDDYANASG